MELAIAYYSMGLAGYEILSVNFGINETVTWRLVGTRNEHRNHTTKLYYTASGRGYFRPYGDRRIYMDECICTGF